MVIGGLCLIALLLIFFFWSFFKHGEISWFHFVSSFLGCFFKFQAYFGNFRCHFLKFEVHVFSYFKDFFKFQV
jgi:hypothetical protein